MAGDLLHVGIDPVDAGVQGMIQLRRAASELTALNQAAKISRAVQPGHSHIPLKSLVLLLRHADREVSAVVPRGDASFPRFPIMPHGDTPSFSLREAARTHLSKGK